jgi:hypothetical protein
MEITVHLQRLIQEDMKEALDKVKNGDKGSFYFIKSINILEIIKTM